MKYLKCAMVVLLTVLTSAGFAQDDYYAKLHFTLQAGFNTTNAADILSKTFASDLYHGTTRLISDYVNIGGSPDNVGGVHPVLNAAVDFSTSPRFKIGVGFNGIPQIHITGYVDKDSLNNPQYVDSLYDRVDEIVTGSTLKLEALYAIKPYRTSGLGWEFDAGGGLTCNFIKTKQNFLLQNLDSTSQQIVSAFFQEENRQSSIGAFLMTRVDVRIIRPLSVVADFNWMFDTGVTVDETHFNFNDTVRKIDAHKLKFNSYLIAIGAALHF